MKVDSEAKYVPPALRAGYVDKQSRETSGTSHEDEFSDEELTRLFDTPELCTIVFFNHESMPPSLKDLISFIVVFDNAHPFWENKKEMWIHAASEQLIEDFNGSRKNFRRPIPLFEGKARKGNFIFKGWWFMDIRNVVQPYSERLKTMLMIKDKAQAYPWGITKKSKNSALALRWLKLRLTPAKGPFEPLKELAQGQAAEYVLRVGGLKEELEIFKNNYKSEAH
ncbi:uncharacterized protein IL334_002483 [Kwoniella shivajii]|uniref:Uncharacterized protein n=1 Tax=Kwoniella shivajii TaxID=564305 RepID=A0ABZ1CUY4_9TREE|nr:hypothetical protein IL334_002483 [Kwoniella shivajii]